MKSIRNFRVLDLNLPLSLQIKSLISLKKNFQALALICSDIFFLKTSLKILKLFIPDYYFLRNSIPETKSLSF